MTRPPFLKETVRVGDRSFLVQVLRFVNGCFVSVSEGDARIGAMAVSIATGPRPITNMIIPSRDSPVFIRMAAESTSTAVAGIAIVSASLKADVDAASAKAIMNQMTDMISNV